MGQQGQCPRCGHTKSWSIRREKRRCAACRYEWRPVALPLRLTVTEWRRLLRWFLRFVDHSQRFSDGQGNHINGLEGFWGYLKRRLAAKGGIRRERLPLYLAEYVWRYNHRQLSRAEQLKKLLKLLQS